MDGRSHIIAKAHKDQLALAAVDSHAVIFIGALGDC
jgi:hypothetical protein